MADSCHAVVGYRYSTFAKVCWSLLCYSSKFPSWGSLWLPGKSSSWTILMIISNLGRYLGQVEQLLAVIILRRMHTVCGSEPSPVGETRNGKKTFGFHLRRKGEFPVLLHCEVSWSRRFQFPQDGSTRGTSLSHCPSDSFSLWDISDGQC